MTMKNTIQAINNANNVIILFVRRHGRFASALIRFSVQPLHSQCSFFSTVSENEQS